MATAAAVKTPPADALLTDRDVLEALIAVTGSLITATLSQCNVSSATAAQTRHAALVARLHPPSPAPGAPPPPTLAPIDTRAAVLELVATVVLITNALGTEVRNTPWQSARKRLETLRARLGIVTA